jgi:Flp pilus assembly protein TadD
VTRKQKSKIQQLRVISRYRFFCRTVLRAKLSHEPSLLSVTGDELAPDSVQEQGMKTRVLGVLFLLVGSALAQFDTSMTVRLVRVRVTFSSGGCDPHVQVKLLGQRGTVAEARSDDQCEADFFDVPPGTYHVSASDKTMADADAGIIEITPSWSAEFAIKIDCARDPKRNVSEPSNASVSAADLAVPARAQKEFDKAGKLMAKQDFTRAIEKLNHAIAIYPSYAAAYNNLGVIYARLGDSAREREQLQKAISVNDHFAPAYVNLGRMDIAKSDFSSAETTLDQAASSDPNNPVTLVLLAYAEVMNRHPDQALASSRRAHALASPHAFAHQVAALAYEQKQDRTSAISELELFLKEEPSGPQAEDARKNLAALQASPH